ncbi:alpha-2-macroglobulin-like protein 1 [Bufo bufo]|uniref:alpha-2-macroglobulin-like protein 1 n=1 Tax=Bufo bufo TaxID=8384 RepID=UPI001ABED45E|nr:alpha-2-macroglobulin-like protein 1 [Bufo bufo]
MTCSMKNDSLIGFLLGLALLSFVHGYIKRDINYMLLIPATLHYPSIEKACLLLDGDLYKWGFIVTVTLEVQEQNLNLCKKPPKTGFHCCYFTVPAPSDGTSEVGIVKIEAQGNVNFVDSKKVLILRVPLGVVIQTDKPSYRPSDTVKFRIVTLDENFVCAKMKYNVVEMKDPNGNRIFQWLDVNTTSCIADLSFVLTSDPILGTYIIRVDNGLALKTFAVEETVLPRFEVTIEQPSMIFSGDPTFLLKVCGKYTYGKGVQGNVNADICNTICTTITGETDTTGCFQSNVDGNLLKFNNYIYNVEIKASLVEDGTGITFYAFKTVRVSFEEQILAFEEMDSYYKGGYPYRITLKAQDRDGAPLQFVNASLEVNFQKDTINVDGKTDKKGKARFTLDTSGWNGQVMIRGNIITSSAGQLDGRIWGPVHFLLPFYSTAESFLRLQPFSGIIPCNKRIRIRVEYVICPSDLMKDYKSVKFYYIVIGTGGIMQHGEELIVLDKETSFNGFLTVPITFTSKFGPAPKMIGFLLLKSGYVTADRVLLSMEKCFPNQAWLKFSQTEASPKAKLSLQIGSSAGSMCAIRAVDKSVQINNEEKELTTENVFSMFEGSVRGGYPDVVQEHQIYRCWNDDYVDVFSLFKETGTKVLTNTQILQPEKKSTNCMMFQQPMMYNNVPMVQPSQSNDAVRKYFPETWLWNLVPIGEFEKTSIQVTVPDTITQFNARSFCVGDSGFGLSPQVSLTVFKPFFVELTLPYSIIQGETLILKASVFNYLKQCLKVQVTLLNTTDFSVKTCQNCMYSSCVCANRDVTFVWNITTNQMGLLPLTVRAEAVAGNDFCDGEKPYVPPSGNLDILQRQLLVKPRGFKKEVTENIYLCLNGSNDHIEKSFSLILPDTWVKNSESAYVSVMGDILGTTLQNLDHLIQMPYGCGEQNMLTMAPIVYVLAYLKVTEQLSAAQKEKAIGYLQSGYQRQLSYKRFDGSYSAFGMNDAEGSTWLTAFVIKCFYQAKSYIFIDDEVLAQAVTWLGLQQQEDGCFISRGMLFHTLMKGGVEDDVSLSAYITIALLERGTPGTDPMLVRALSCLKNKVSNSSNLYTVALLAYTFALSNDFETKQILLEKLFPFAVSSGGNLYWMYTIKTVDYSISASVELSSYILLALITTPTLAASELQKGFQIVNWLMKQQNSYGGFSSTQDTVVAIQALAKYTSITYTPKGSVSVTVSQNKKTVGQFQVDETNRLLLQMVPLPIIPGDYGLTFKGKGCVFTQSVLKYYELLPQGAPFFSIDAKIGDCGRDNQLLTIQIIVSYTGDRKVTNMVLIEVEMLSGYQLSSIGIVKIKYFPLVKKVDVRQDSLTIYLEGLGHKSNTYYIHIQQETQVKDLKPANIRVYDYYQTEENTKTTYSPCP